MNEDAERLKATSEKFAETIIKAFKLRFPAMTVDSKTITINSLLISVMSFIKSISDKEERESAAAAVIESWIFFLNELERMEK